MSSRKQRAAMIEQTLAGGASFIATAKEFSDDSVDGNGGQRAVASAC